MIINISSKVEKELISNGLVDDRKIWSYAQMKAKIIIKEEPATLYGLTLVCINQDIFSLYFTEFNSTKFVLVYECAISEMENVTNKKLFLGLRRVLSFSKGVESFQLEMGVSKKFIQLFGSAHD